MYTTQKTKDALQNLEEIIFPHTLSNFSQQFWDQELLTIERNQTDYYHSLFSIKEVDKVLGLHHPTGKAIRVVKNQVPLDKTKYENPDGTLNLNQIYAAYADGHTIVVNEINSFWNPLKQLCQNLTDETGHRTVANMYLTPKNQKALLPHYDTHDVFVIQVEGTKHWKVYDSVYETPLVNSYQPIFQREQLSGMKEITLNAGDMMYIPRGIPHEAVTTGKSSLHLTLGMYSVQYADAISKSLQSLAMNHVSLRKALPIGHHKNPFTLSEELKENFTAIVNQLLSEDALHSGLQMLREEERTKKTPAIDGHFDSLDLLDTIGLDTVVCKRNNTNCNIQQTGNAARIIFSGNVIKGPAAITPVLEFIANQPGTFKITELPLLNSENKLKLIKRLIRGGLLSIKTNHQQNA